MPRILRMLRIEQDIRSIRRIRSIRFTRSSVGPARAAGQSSIDPRVSRIVAYTTSDPAMHVVTYQ